MTPRKEDKCMIITSSIKNLVIISMKHNYLNCDFCVCVCVSVHVYGRIANWISSSTLKILFFYVNERAITCCISWNLQCYINNVAEMKVFQILKTDFATLELLLRREVGCSFPCPEINSPLCKCWQGEMCLWNSCWVEIKLVLPYVFCIVCTLYV